jgi:ABC-type uncharacterized transport system permease subunit
MLLILLKMLSDEISSLISFINIYVLSFNISYIILIKFTIRYDTDIKKFIHQINFNDQTNEFNIKI